MEKWEDKKVFSFPRLYLVERMEKWRNRKLFGLVENKVCINLPSYLLCIDESGHFKK